MGDLSTHVMKITSKIFSGYRKLSLYNVSCVKVNMPICLIKRRINSWFIFRSPVRERICVTKNQKRTEISDVLHTIYYKTARKFPFPSFLGVDLKWTKYAWGKARSVLVDYECFLEENVVKREWELERKHSSLEGYAVARVLGFTSILSFVCLWESFSPPSLFWVVLFPMYVNWFVNLGFDFLKPWKSAIFLSILIASPFKLSLCETNVWSVM